MNPMRFDLPVFPDPASTMAGRVDHIYLFLVSLSVFMTLAIFLCIIIFAIRYRRGSSASRANIKDHSWPLEIVWSVIPLIVLLFTFGWGAKIFYDGFHAPPNALRVYVDRRVAKEFTQLLIEKNPGPGAATGSVLRIR